mmetsp:Transcript_110280/g.206711  ORF Transcript_110280/g.206711 Transcript_110280/m.206711 type:complete len:407 (-) Transcript_110280:120-1340(-)
MCKIALTVVFASVVNCRGWHASHGVSKGFGTQQSREISALRTLLLAPNRARPAHPGHRPRFPAARMQVQTEEKPKVEKEEKVTPTGPFAPIVLGARDAIGAQELQKIRAQVIKQHSKVIADFVDTSDSKFGQNVLKRMFEAADKDDNGSLDREELRQALTSLGFVATTDKDLDKIMKKADKDDNEVIDFEEFVKAAPPILKNQLTQLAKANGHDLGFMVDLKSYNGKSNEENEEFISEEFQENLNELAYLFMRLAVGAVMIHHGQEKILSSEMFTKFAIDKYFSFLPGPHIYWTYLVGYIQYLAPFFMGLGIFSRAAAASLTGVMAGALFQDLIQNGWEKFPMFELAGLSQKLKYGVPIFHNYGFEVPLLYVAVFGLVAIKGPGKFSIAQLLGWNDDNSLLGKLKQ